MEKKTTTASTDIFERHDRTTRQAAVFDGVWGLGIAATGFGLLLWCALIVTVAQYLTKSSSYDGWSGATQAVLLVATQPKFYLGVFASAFVLIGGGTVYKSAQISAEGPGSVARSVGGERLEGDAPENRRLRNVVDEMTLAAGIVAPELFVLKREKQINAFAVGDSSCSALGVTAGALRRLPRDELLGVVAHEIGHLVSEDSDRKTRSLGAIFGLRVVETLGGKIASGARFCVGASASAPFNLLSDEEDGEGAGWLAAILFMLGCAFCWAICFLAAVVFAVSFGVWAIGSASVFFTCAVQAGGFRRREFLADCWAARLTRNPTGLAKALRRIQWEEAVPTEAATRSPETARLFFTSVYPRGWKAYIFRTHPDLSERIKRLDPAVLDWDPTK